VRADGDVGPVTTAHLQFLGTGTAFHTDGRGSQCVLVCPAASPAFLVDLGPTAMAAAVRYGVRTDRLDRLFITHLHGDHVAGWPFLLLHMNFVERRSRPFEVHGPVGLRDCLEGLMSLCYPDVLHDPQLGFDIVYHELPIVSRAGYDAGATGFDTEPMDHHPSSLGYRFRVDGTTVAVTGDTRWGECVGRLATSSDVLVIECSSVERHPHSHVCLDEIRDGRDVLGDCEVVLVHLTDEVAARLAADPIAGVVAAYDGMIYPLEHAADP
jgi:ribonuclease BN (tRNA processing enzyme)